MQLNKYTYPFVIFMIIGLFSACKKDKMASEIPSIEFKDLQRFTNDSLAFTIHFIDGDGDIGLTPGDTLPPYNVTHQEGDPLFVFTYFQGTNLVKDSFNINAFSISMRYYAFEDGEWNEPELRPLALFPIDDIQPTGQNKYLEGDLTFGLNLPDIDGQNSWVKDSIKFEVLLKDRTLHSSNIVETPLIVID